MEGMGKDIRIEEMMYMVNIGVKSGWMKGRK